MVASARPRQVAYFEETTFATAPTNWDQAIQAGTAEQILSIEPDVTGLQQAVLENENSVLRTRARHTQLHGLKSEAGFSLGTYLHGNPTTAALDAQAGRFHLSRLFKNAMGGEMRSYRKNVDGGTSTVVQLANVTNLTAGMWGAFYDATTEELSFSQITDISGTSVFLQPGLPFTPASGSDIMYACVSCHFDQDALDRYTDSDNTTLSFFVKGEDDEDCYQTVGCKLTPTIEAIEAGAPTMVSWDVQVVDFENSGLTVPALTGSDAGQPPLVAGTGDDTRFYFGNQSGSLDPTMESQLEPIIGISHQKVMGPSGREGVHYYTGVPTIETGLNVTMTNYSSSYAVEFRANTKKAALIQVGTAVGQAFAIYYPHLEYAADPQRGVNADLVASTLQFRAQEDDLETSATGQSLEALRSPVTIVFVA